MVKPAKRAPVNKPDMVLPYEPAHGTKWWTSDMTDEAFLQEAPKGPASYATTPKLTIPALLEMAVKKNGNKPAIASEMAPPLKKGQAPPEPTPLKDWKTWTWNEYRNDARKVSKALIVSGLKQFDSVVIFGFNSPQWALGFLGACLSGGKAAGIYPSDTPAVVQYKSDHSNAAVAICQNEATMETFRGIVDNLPYLKAIVCWEADPGDDITTSDGRTIKTYTWDAFVKLGDNEDDTELDKRTAAISPGHCAALIYTSGTTGAPKAVMVSHDNMVFTSSSVMTATNGFAFQRIQERIVSYLPLSHIAGLMIDIICPITGSSGIGAFNAWCTTHFARSYDLKRGTLVARLQTVQPTFFLGVPRVWEKIMERLKEVGATTKGIAKKISTFAKAKGAKYTKARLLGGSGKTPGSFFLANIILNKIKQKLGLDKCRLMLSGAAPLTIDTLEYFGSLGININEVYGMSETTGVVTWSTDECHLWGSVGFEIPGCEIRIIREDKTEAPEASFLFKAAENEQGEICFRGRQIMMGYVANPRLGDEHVKEIEEKNNATIDSEGFLHSGDKGVRDLRGMIKITGRYKELIIGAGGENIAPVPIEDELKRVCPFISNAVMVGNKRKFNVMLLTLKVEGATGELPGGNKLSGAAAGLSDAKTLEDAMKSDVFIKAITDAITSINKNGDVVPSNAAKVQKFTILPRDLSVVTDELTATFKLKRSVVEGMFDPIISKMFEVDDVYVNYNLAPTVGLKMGSDDQPAPEPVRSMSLNLDNAVEEAANEAEKAAE